MELKKREEEGYWRSLVKGGLTWRRQRSWPCCRELNPPPGEGVWGWANSRAFAAEEVTLDLQVMQKIKFKIPVSLKGVHLPTLMQPPLFPARAHTGRAPRPSCQPSLPLESGLR